MNPQVDPGGMDLMDDDTDANGIDWRSGVPVSRRFDDPYFSLDDGLAETRHVFLAGNQLPERFRDGFHIAELGFGTGLNLLATLILWMREGCNGTFRFTSFEAYPLTTADVAAALEHVPETAPLRSGFLAAWGSGLRNFRLGPAMVDVIVGDAATALPVWQGRADAWYLDGFSPAKNPGLWGPDLMGSVAEHTAPGGTFATYTAAGHVRRALAGVGFEVERVPGYGRKRHMTRGRLRPPQEPADA